METQIIELEKEYWQAMENRDFATIKRLTRFPCIVAGKNGIRQVDEATFKAMFDSSENMQLKGHRNFFAGGSSHPRTDRDHCLPDHCGISSWRRENNI